MYGAPFEETQFITAGSQPGGVVRAPDWRLATIEFHWFLLLLEGFVRRRIAVAAVLAVGLALGTAGCTFFAPQATLIKYNPSDGVSLDLGKLQVRNAFVISPKGTDANLIGVFINSGSSPISVELEYTAHVKGEAQVL